MLFHIIKNILFLKNIDLYKYIIFKDFKKLFKILFRLYLIKLWEFDDNYINIKLMT